MFARGAVGMERLRKGVTKSSQRRHDTVWIRHTAHRRVLDMPHPARAHAGQASVEWIGLVLLVALLFGLGAAMAQAGFLGRRVTREMARAMCVVRSGDCERDREPCAVSSDGHRGRVAVHLAVVKLGGGTVAVLEQRSDGTVAVTRGTTALLGIEAGLGAARDVSLAGISASTAAALTASYTSNGEQARTWIVESPQAARRLIESLRPRQMAVTGRGATPLAAPGPAPPPPDITYRQISTEAAINAGLQATAGDDDVQLVAADLRFPKTAGTRIDHRTGHRTIYVQLASSAKLDVRGVLGLSHADGGERYAVELDAQGRPVDLQVQATGRFGGSTDLPDVAQPIAGLLAHGSADGRVYEIDAHLDLTDPENLAAARGLINAMSFHFGSPAAASQALRRRLDEQGTVEARVLRQTDDTQEHALQSPLGPRVGIAWGHEDRSTELLAATSRGLDGNWVPRTDCVA
jgi:hypothetical protein